MDAQTPSTVTSNESGPRYRTHTEGQKHSNAVLTAIILGAGFVFASGQAPTSEIIVVPARADAHRLRTGRFIYRDSNRRKQLGTSRIIIEKSAIAGDYAFSAETIGYLDQQWE